MVDEHLQVKYFISQIKYEGFVPKVSKKRDWVKKINVVKVLENPVIKIYN